MLSIKSVFSNMFNRVKHPVQLGLPKMRFGADAATVTHVGTLRVDSPTYKMKNSIIPFGFEGVSEAPPMNLNHLQRIYEDAAMQGYTVHEVVTYGKNIGMKE